SARSPICETMKSRKRGIAETRGPVFVIARAAAHGDLTLIRLYTREAFGTTTRITGGVLPCWPGDAKQPTGYLGGCSGRRREGLASCRKVRRVQPEGVRGK